MNAAARHIAEKPVNISVYATFSVNGCDTSLYLGMTHMISRFHADAKRRIVALWIFLGKSNRHRQPAPGIIGADISAHALSENFGDR